MSTKIVDLSGNIPNFGKLLVLRYLILGIVTQIPIIGGLESTEVFIHKRLGDRMFKRKIGQTE
jgi:hypothetical protein